MVAVSLALQAPYLVRSLVLLSGYYFPTARLDTALNAPLAFPVIGDALRYTVSPLLARLMLPAGIRAMFSRIDSHLLRDQPLREAAEQRTDAHAPPGGAQDPGNPRCGEVASPW